MRPQRLGLQQFGLGHASTGGSPFDAEYALAPLLVDTSRTSSATVIQYDGSLTTVGSGVQAINGLTYSAPDFSDAGLTVSELVRTKFGIAKVYDEAPYLLCEGEATNLIAYSEDLSGYGKVRATVTTDATTAPDGTTTADKIVEDTTLANSHLVTYNVTSVGLGIYTFTTHVRAAERGYACVRITGSTNGTPAVYSVVVSLSTGEVTSTYMTGAAPTGYEKIKITELVSGWWRVSLTTEHATGTTVAGTVFPALAGSLASNPTYDGDGTSGIYSWGWQITNSYTEESYIKTDGATATRAAATNVLCDASGTALTPAQVGWTAGTIYGELTLSPRLPTASGDGYAVSSYSDASNYVGVNVTDAGVITFTRTVSGTPVTVTSTATAADGASMTVRFYADTTNGIGISVDGEAWVTDADTTSAVLGTTVEIGTMNGTSRLDGAYEIGKLKTYSGRQQAITDGGWSDL